MPSDTLLRGILDANATYADAFSKSDPALLAKLAVGQSPKICWLGCSDSRVSAELATGVAPGSIFVHRNIAQCFHPTDPSALAALQYAVHVLKVEAVIVCGHTSCGGVKAGMSSAAEERTHGSKPAAVTEGEKIIAQWVAPIHDLALKQLKSSPSSDALGAESLSTLTESHVAETVRLVSESSIVTEAWKNGQELSVHGWIYHVGTAKLQDLDIGFQGPGVPATSLLASSTASEAGDA